MFNFEKLDVWQEAIEFATRKYMLASVKHAAAFIDQTIVIQLIGGL
jgi:hypothetical protein